MVHSLSNYETGQTEEVNARANGAGINDENKDLLKTSDKRKSSGQPTLRIKTVRDILSEQPRKFLVEQVIPEQGLGVLWAQSGNGKTFAALDLAYAVARGVDWHGHAVIQGSVLYVSLEGWLQPRIQAHLDYNNVEAQELKAFCCVEHSIDMTKGGASLLLNAIHTAGIRNLKLIVIDTLNRAMPGGNENASEDMGRMIGAATKLIESTGAALMFIHHCGKQESQGSRGHSSLKAATDFELSIKSKAKVQTLRLEKARDAKDGYPLFKFKLSEYSNSAALIPLDGEHGFEELSKLGTHDRTALIFLEQLLKDRPNRGKVSLKKWRDLLFKEAWVDAKEDAKAQRISRAKRTLEHKGLIAFDSEYVWTIDNDNV